MSFIDLRRPGRTHYTARHTDVDDDLVLRAAPLIVDTRGVYRGRNGNVVRA